jgi:hypothetical protein
MDLIPCLHGELAWQTEDEESGLRGREEPQWVEGGAQMTI